MVVCLIWLVPHFRSSTALLGSCWDSSEVLDSQCCSGRVWFGLWVGLHCSFSATVAALSHTASLQCPSHVRYVPPLDPPHVECRRSMS